MRWIVATVLLAAQVSALPPPYPREGATKVFENDRVQVWDIAWLKQQYPLHHHVYDLRRGCTTRQGIESSSRNQVSGGRSVLPPGTRRSSAGA